MALLNVANELSLKLTEVGIGLQNKEEKNVGDRTRVERFFFGRVVEEV